MGGREAARPGAVTDVDDGAARLAVALGRLIRILRRNGPAELGPGSVSALATVVRHGPLRLGDLAIREGVAPPTLTRIIARLEEGGLVVRRADPVDGRASQVEATPAAAGIVAGLGSSRSAALAERITALSAADQDALLKAIPVIEQLAAD